MTENSVVNWTSGESLLRGSEEPVLRSESVFDVNVRDSIASLDQAVPFATRYIMRYVAICCEAGRSATWIVADEENVVPEQPARNRARPD